jgi:hypothetical protein
MPLQLLSNVSIQTMVHKPISMQNKMQGIQVQNELATYRVFSTAMIVRYQTVRNGIRLLRLECRQCWIINTRLMQAWNILIKNFFLFLTTQKK